MDIVGVAQRCGHGRRSRLGHLGDFAEAGEDGGGVLSALLQSLAEFLALEYACEFSQQLFREAEGCLASEQRIHQARSRARPRRAGQQHVCVNDQFHARVVRLSLL